CGRVDDSNFVLATVAHEQALGVGIVGSASRPQAYVIDVMQDATFGAVHNPYAATFRGVGHEDAVVLLVNHDFTGVFPAALVSFLTQLDQLLDGAVQAVDCQQRAVQGVAHVQSVSFLVQAQREGTDRKSTRLNSSHVKISY